MSWFKKNYDKAVMGLAVVSLLGVAASRFMGTATADTNVSTGKEGDTVPFTGLKEKLTAVIEKVNSPAMSAPLWTENKLNESQVARLMLGPSLVLPTGEEKEPFDALDPKAPPLRGDVPNAWLLKHNLDITRSKILTRDDDGDKFNNEEEFRGGSNPRDPNSTPSAVLKLKLDEIIALKCELKFRAGAEFQFRRVWETEPGQEQSKGNLNAKVGQPLNVADEGRFQLVSVTDEQIDGKPVKVATVTDSLVKEGSPFKIPADGVVNRPILIAKISCTMGTPEAITAKAGEGLAFKAFNTINFKLLKIDQPANSVEVEYSEGGNPAKTQQIKKD